VRERVRDKKEEESIVENWKLFRGILSTLSCFYLFVVEFVMETFQMEFSLLYLLFGISESKRERGRCKKEEERIVENGNYSGEFSQPSPAIII
jgi:hypothetical protein